MKDIDIINNLKFLSATATHSINRSIEASFFDRRRHSLLALLHVEYASLL